MCLDPPGTLIEADVAREAANDVLGRLRDLGVAEHGSIVITNPTATPFKRADDVDAAAKGDPDDAVVWDQLRAAARDGVKSSVSFHVFLCIAVMLAAIAVITDSAVLVVGAMGLPAEITGSAKQLGINLLGMLIAGTLTLVAQRVLWGRVNRMRLPLA